MGFQLGSPVQLQNEAQNLEEGKSFQLLLHEAVVSGLTEVLGAAGARAAFFHLKLTEFATAAEVHRRLVGIFGMGTQSLESSILRNLFSRMGSSFEPEESMTFPDYVGVAKRIHARPRRG